MNPESSFNVAYLYALLQENQSLFQDIISYDSQNHTITLYLDRGYILQRTHNGQHDIYTIQDFKQQAVSWSELEHIRIIIENQIAESRAISRRSRAESRESQEISRRSGSESRESRAESRESRAEIREDKRRVVLTLAQSTLERPEQREKLILFLKNNNLDNGLLLDIQDEQTHNNECLDSFCSLLEQKGILYHDSQSQQHTTNIHLWNTLLDNQLEMTYSPKTIYRHRRRHRDDEEGWR